MTTNLKNANEMVKTKSGLKSYRWLFLRRISQISLLALFLLGPWFDLWIVKGSIASSLTLDVLPLTDPYLLLQSWLAGQDLGKMALIGALIVLIFYLLVGGRMFCSWVCPINVITDMAAYLHQRWQIKKGIELASSTRYWLFGLTLVLAYGTGTLIWELVNPVTMVYRGLIFGMGLAWGMILAIFLFDLLISQRGWCGHLCPVGAFYSLLGQFSLLRIGTPRQNQCNKCMDCLKVCPEPQVLKPVFKTTTQNPIILSAYCTNCGRCIDVCQQEVFNLTTRFHT